MVLSISRFFSGLGGADAAILEKVPTARHRYAQMGGVLLTTASVAAVSMAFAMHDGLRAHWGVSTIMGIAWGLVILNLDRLLMLSLMRANGARGTILMAAPRLLMAAVLAVVISTPLVLRIFQQDIITEMDQIHLKRSAQLLAQEANSGETALVGSLEKKIAALNDIRAGRQTIDSSSPKVMADSADVSRLDAETKGAQRARDVAYEAYQCELYGSSCRNASSRRGPGVLARAKEAQYNDAQANLSSLQRQLLVAQSALRSDQNAVISSANTLLREQQKQATDQIPGLQRQLNKAQAQVDKTQQTDSANNRTNRGILEQL